MTSNIDNRKIKVAHFIWLIPHYRAPIFRKLCQNPWMNFIIYAGDNTQLVGGSSVVSANQLGKMENINWVPLKSIRIKHGPFRDYEWQPEVVKLAFKEDFDAVICFGGRSLSNLILKIVCRLRGIAVIEWGMGVRGPESKFKWFTKVVHGKIAQSHLVYGKFASDWYACHGFKSDKIFTVRNSLDYETQVKIRSNLTSKDINEVHSEFGCKSPDSRLIFYSGRLERRKDLHLLIKAIKILKDKNKEVRVLVIGDGLLKNSLREQAKTQKVSRNIIFYGACYDEEELGRLISACDLCVVPGAIGLTVMHSMVYGVPVLTRDNKTYVHGPEVEAIIEGQTGGFYKQGNANDLARKIEAMLYPEPVKNVMSENCKKMIDEEFTPAYQEKVIIQCLNSVLPKAKKIPLP